MTDQNNPTLEDTPEENLVWLIKREGCTTTEALAALEQYTLRQRIDELEHLCELPGINSSLNFSHALKIADAIDRRITELQQQLTQGGNDE